MLNSRGGKRSIIRYALLYFHNTTFGCFMANFRVFAASDRFRFHVVFLFLVSVFRRSGGGLR